MIAIIGILIGLLLPAINAAREAGRLTNCKNNLRQLGIAMLAFESSAGQLPPGTMAKYRFSYDFSDYGGHKTYGYEWPYMLHFMLPWLEQNGLFKALHGPKFDIQNPWYDPNDFPPTSKVLVPTFLCPDDKPSSQLKIASTSPLVGVPGSNYLGIFSGLNDWDNYYLTGYGTPADDGSSTPPNPPVKRRAVFGYCKGTRLAEITDGTSHTLAMGEYLTGLDSFDLRGWINTNRAGSQFLYVTLTPNSRAPDNLLNWYQYSCPTDGSRNAPAMNLPCTPGTTDFNYASPRSHHPGGVSVLFCDGSVHFAPDEIDLTIWQSLGWMADGQVTSLGF